MSVLVVVLVAMTSPTPVVAPVCEGECRRRVQRRERRHRRVAEMARYRAHPMPACTWFGESGRQHGEWAPARYRARNPRSSARGKFQILADSTWRAFGGGDDWSPVVQERIARRVLNGQGLGAWVLCG